MKIIDVDTWKRKNHYENFIAYDYPIFSIATNLDVTDLVVKCKEENLSFFATFLYVVMKSINETEDLKIRICDGNIVVYDKVVPHYIVMAQDGVIVTCRSEASDDFKTFYDAVRADISDARQNSDRHSFNISKKNDCVYFSCLPWLEITSVTNAYNISDKNQASIPRITWGKYVQGKDGRYTMGFDVAAHHALLDGKSVCDMINSIIGYLNNIDKIIK